MIRGKVFRKTALGDTLEGRPYKQQSTFLFLYPSVYPPVSCVTILPVRDNRKKIQIYVDRFLQLLPGPDGGGWGRRDSWPLVRVRAVISGFSNTAFLAASVGEETRGPISPHKSHLTLAARPWQPPSQQR